MGKYSDPSSTPTPFSPSQASRNARCAPVSAPPARSAGTTSSAGSSSSARLPLTRAPRRSKTMGIVSPGFRRRSTAVDVAGRPHHDSVEADRSHRLDPGRHDERATPPAPDRSGARRDGRRRMRRRPARPAPGAGGAARARHGRADPRSRPPRAPGCSGRRMHRRTRGRPTPPPARSRSVARSCTGTATRPSTAAPGLPYRRHMRAHEVVQRDRARRCARAATGRAPEPIAAPQV